MEDYSAQLPWIIMAVNGLVVGWFAGVMLGRGGLIRDVFLGIIGSFIGGALVYAGLLKLPFTTGHAYGDQIVVSTIGAFVLIVLGRVVAR